MKYSLSFCNITQITDNIFEVFENKNVTIDKECADESWKFWDELRTEPFSLLVHCSEIPLSFQGAQEIGRHPLHQKVALFIDTPGQEQKLEVVMDVKKMIGTPLRYNVFYDREKAMEWLEGKCRDRKFLNDGT
ncbi:MAG: hypothetical protein K9K37_10445 [Desulfocapsa sp.]|nr:hypothetical protein [Desulfocapsa sp.]